MYENSDCQVLNESDFQDVRTEVSKLAADWQGLGSALGLSRAAISEIKMACRGNPSRCLDGVIERWLNQDYNWEKFGVPSWSKLADAVESRSGGKDPALAKKIRLARVSTEQSAMSAPQAVQTTDKQAGDQVLDEGDFQQVRRELASYTSHWQSLALALGLSDAAISEIDMAYRGDPSRCLDGLIERWLKQNYDYSQFGLPSWNKVRVAVESLGSERDPIAAVVKKPGPAHNNGTSAEQSGVPLHQAVRVERSEVQVNQTAQSTLRTSGITNGMVQTHIGPTEMPTAHLPVRSNQQALNKFPLQVMSSDELTSISQVVPSVAYPKKHSNIHAEELLSHPVEPLGPNVLQAETTHLPASSGQAQVPSTKSTNATLQTHNPPIPSTRSHDPLIPSAKSHDPPIPLAESHDPPVPSVRSHDASAGSPVPIVPSPRSHDSPAPAAESHYLRVVSLARSHDPPVPLSESHDPSVSSVRPRDLPVPSARPRDLPVPSVRPLVLSAGSHNTPVPLARPPDSPLRSTRSHDPPVPLARSPDSPLRSPRSHDPPVPLARLRKASEESHDPPVSSVGSHDLPVPSVRSHDASARSHDPPVLSAGSHDTPVPLAMSPDSPVRLARSHDPPIPLARLHKASEGSHDLPVPSVRSHYAPVPSARSRGASAKSHDPTLPLGSPKLTIDPVVPSASSHVTSEPMVLPAKAPADPTLAYAAPTVPSHATPVARYSSPATEPLDFLPVQTTTKEKSKTSPIVQTQRRVEYAIGLKALQNDLARLDGKWYSIGVLLNISAHELGRIDSKSNELLDLKNVLVRWLSTTPTPMKSDLVEMLRSNAIDSHDLATLLKRHQDIPDTRPLVIDDFEVLLDLLSPLSKRWEDIAIQLDVSTRQLPSGSLESISSSNAIMLRMMLQRLQNVSPPPTLHDLIQALSSPVIGETAYAEELRQKYCSGGSRSAHDVLLFPQDAADIRVEMDYTSNIKSIHSEAQASPSPASPICVHSDTVSSMEMTSPPLHVKSTDTESTVSIIAGGIIKREENESNILSSSAMSTFGVSNKFCVPVVSAEPSLAQQNTSIAPASTSSPTQSINGLASDRWCEKGSQPIDSKPPDQARGVPLNSSMSMELNAGIIKTEENESNLSLSSSAMSTFGLMSNKFCVPAVSAEPSLAQQNISIAPASISSSTPSISGLASDRWCEKGSQPIDSHLPDQATGVPLNSSTSMELNAVYANLAVGAGSVQDKLEKTGDTYKQLEVNESSSSIGQNSNAWAEKPISAQQSLDQQNIRQLPGLQSRANNAGNGFHNTQEALSMSSSAALSLTSGPSSDRWCAITRQTTDPAPKLSDQSYHLEVASDVIGSYNTADNMGVQNRMATVKDENESMAGASSVDTSQEFRGPSSSKLYSADLLPNEQERVANLENEEESMQHLSVQNTDSLSFSDPGRFYGTNIQTAEAAVANLPSDQGLGKEAEDILTQKEQRSIASVEEV
eukprot:Em0004g985a